jgi:predicted esterase
MTETRTLRTETLGRYLVEGPSLEAPLLVGFHGYGQNAEMLLDDLRRIPGAEAWSLVSIQALHRFYNTKTQEVVGSWMTRLDRDESIADNLAYVARVIEALRTEGRKGPLVFAGFSQGAAMAWRAAASIPCDGLIVLGGDLPADVAKRPGLALPPILLGRGDGDSFYTASQLEKDALRLKDLDATVQILRFEGGHTWGQDFLDTAGVFLARLV